MTLWRLLSAVLLSLILGWGSVAQAVAHGEMAGVSDVVLCDSTGQGMTISLDAEGKPVTRQTCLHCLAAAGLAVLADPALPLLPLNLPRAVALPDAAPQLAAILAPARVLARAPPAMV